ncbi:MAG: BLUF domain-containing protein, partial [Gammaproteobacteria bacterium]|nr:BLUF domain-containing protein [Gammaproteobacteria bacterium]
MRLSRLIYKSTAKAEVVSNRMLRDIEEQASAANIEKGITGLLVLTGNIFLQVLEGSARDVTALFGNIIADKRHDAVELVTFQPIGGRYFDEWSMRTVDLYDLPGDKRALMVAKYGGKEGHIAIPDDEHLVHAFLLDAKFVCSSTPWKPTDGSVESAPSGKSSSR